MWTCKNILCHFSKFVSVFIFGLGYIGELIWETLSVADINFSLYIQPMENKVKWNRETSLKPLSCGRQEEKYNCLLRTHVSGILSSYFILHMWKLYLKVVSTKVIYGVCHSYPIQGLHCSGHCSSWMFLVQQEYFPVLRVHCAK